MLPAVLLEYKGITMKSETLKILNQHKLIVRMDGFSPDLMLYTAEALIKGGIKAMEVRFEGEGEAQERQCLIKLSGLKKCFGKDLAVGCGNVRTDRYVKLAVGAGADFITAPNVSKEVLERAAALNTVAIPGAFTATEIETAHRNGADLVALLPTKFCDNYNYAHEVAKALPHVSLVAAGDIGYNDITPLLNIGIEHYIVGGSLAGLQLAKKQEYTIITNEAKRYVELLSK